MIKKFIFIAELLRVKQWVKNAFILFPIIFSGNLKDLALLKTVLITFWGFCLTASSVYVLNDFIDSEKDRLHPKKSLRPLVQNKFPYQTIVSIILSLMICGLLLCLWANPFILFMAVVYLAVHLTYNFFTKHIVILDVIFVAVGFQIRIWAGAYAANVLPSAWLQLCVFLLALFLGFNKRRHELESLGLTASLHRRVLSHYTTYLLDQLIIISSTLAIVFYGLYTISPDIQARVGNHNMVYSVVFVIYGMFRYLYLVHVKKIGDDPGEVLIQDKPLIVNVLLWVVFIVFVLYK